MTGLWLRTRVWLANRITGLAGIAWSLGAEGTAARLLRVARRVASDSPQT